MARIKKHEKIKREINIHKYIAITALTALVFILGILLGNYIANTRLSSLEKTQADLTMQISGLELKNTLMKSVDVCNLTWNELLEEKVDMGKKVERLEMRFGKENENVLRQKEIYELIEIRTWLILREMREKCNASINLILYFYTNKENDEKGSWRQCEDQGYVLDAVYQRYPQNISTFIFDINIQNPAVDTIQQIYDINKVPSLVINEEVYVEYKNFKSLEEILKLS